MLRKACSALILITLFTPCVLTQHPRNSPPRGGCRPIQLGRADKRGVSLYAKVFSKRICFKNICTQAEVVDRILKLQQGLMFRKSLDPENSMLFVFQKEGYHDFWMKNMNFPLDIIWIDKDKFIVGITKDARPCGTQDCQAFTVQEKVKYVLEVVSGFADKYKVRVGDQVDF